MTLKIKDYITTYSLNSKYKWSTDNLWCLKASATQRFKQVSDNVRWQTREGGNKNCFLKNQQSKQTEASNPF